MGNNDTDTGAAYGTCDASVVILQRCAGKKRERTPRFKSVSSGEAFTENNGHIDVVEHSSRLLEFLRLRRQQRCDNRSLFHTEDPDGSDEVVSTLKQSESHSAPPISFSLVELPKAEKSETQSNGFRCGGESLLQEGSSLLRPQAAVRSTATQTQAETQLGSSDSNDQMAVSSLTKADLLMLRLCELDALLHIFFS
ncbi:hypothetical protein TraAM80_05324 [Trypanosoma rangeli]|uniref:Uncharacterized protein n=1 Tax=Trypanosoma rangeli TaxID=5698 RepID=A0A3R7KYR8_TRYRA|nr:uncharacterized protein TraAM80_05324 [Trypanosoma rangeli]RNF04047.1 hypothetical protein TraAM80_05324 [Trypanosoma rangeli]|eukprot:RNF04047.1 hypothetical protein TraAM80_05324 [Trypanosoma rangeli]